jgi:hypothetical protein
MSISKLSERAYLYLGYWGQSKLERQLWGAAV